MASDRDLKTLSRQRMTCSAGDGAPAQRFSADERLRAAPLEPREGLSQAKTLLPLGRSVSKKRTIYVYFPSKGVKFLSEYFPRHP